MAIDLDEYRALVAKVDSFFTRVQGRYGAELACRAGCDGCCQFRLTVSPVEAEEIRRGVAALPKKDRARLAKRARAIGDAMGPCPALEPDGRCGIYDVRPIVCRTHGLPMRVPGDARLPVLGDGLGGGVNTTGLSVCPLNFTTTPIERVEADCLLDLGTIDALLAVINARAVPDDESARLARLSIGDVLLAAHLP